jgi:hypothetical protein
MRRSLLRCRCSMTTHTRRRPSLLRWPTE